MYPIHLLLNYLKRFIRIELFSFTDKFFFKNRFVTLVETKEFSAILNKPNPENFSVKRVLYSPGITEPGSGA
jgi:hypothetical protein